MPAGNPNIKELGKNTRWKPGKSGNPLGKPALPDLGSAMAKVLSAENKKGETALEEILNKLRQMAANGNPKAIEILLSRGYGMPRQDIKMEITDPDGFDPTKLTDEELDTYIALSDKGRAKGKSGEVSA